MGYIDLHLLTMKTGLCNPLVVSSAIILVNVLELTGILTTRTWDFAQFEGPLRLFHDCSNIINMVKMSVPSVVLSTIPYLN